MTIKNSDIRDIDVLKTWVLTSTLNFTRYFFKHNQNRKFVVGSHHEKISDALNRVLKGEVKRLIINVAPRYGKAIDCNTDMLTIDGWKKANELTIGDYVFGSDGKPTKIIGVYPQGITNAYKVEFSDDTYLITCSEHLWSLNHKDLSRKDKFTFQQIRKTKDLIGKLYANDGHKLWHIPNVQSLEIDDRNDLEIDPYLLGCWLGDGHSHTASITTMDEEIISKFESYNTVVRTHQNSGKAITYGLRNNFISKLKQLNLHKNKHIPLKYLLSSHKQRLELLRGLCDTDGTVNRKNNQVSFCSTNEVLLQNVKELICSLGGIYKEYRNSLFFKIKDCPFHLERKKKFWKPLTRRHFTKRFIKSITKVEDRETVCFTVDAKDSLFCAGRDLIVTHNTELAVKNFIAMGLGLNPKAKFIHLSYSDDLALDNSDGVRDIIELPEYQQLFETRLSNRGKKKWYTTEGGGLYATSSSGQVTGFGAGLVDKEIEEELNNLDEFIPAVDGTEFGGAIIIDDPIKPDDATSATIRNKVNNKFDTTIKNRVNSRNTPIIIIMQRLHVDDLCGKLIREEGEDWEVLELPCIYTNEEGEEVALWEFKHTLAELRKEKEKNSFVFETQYMQNPKPLEGLMYDREFRTYEAIPYSKSAIRKAYIDTADEGKDYLCAISYEEQPHGNYILDVLYTQKPMEYTEPKTAESLTMHAIEEAVIESNNGGRGFARNVEKQMREMGNNETYVDDFHQSLNKNVRIFTRSNEVMNLTFFPVGWDKLWPTFHTHITTYMKVGKNEFDDAPDALTGTVERRGESSIEETEDILSRLNF